MRLPECACVPGGVSVAGGARLWHAFTPPGFVIMRLVSRSTNLMITARRLTSVRVAGAGEVHEDRVQRACCADEQVVALRAAEGEVGHDLGNVELSEQRAVRVEAVQPIRGRRPDAAAGVEADAIEVAGAAGGEDLATGECGVIGHLEGPHLLTSAVDDV